MAIRAVMFDFGGVVTTSPFEAFARLEAERSLPTGFIRTRHAADPDDNAWARREWNEFGLDTSPPRRRRRPARSDTSSMAGSCSSGSRATSAGRWSPPSTRAARATRPPASPTTSRTRARVPKRWPRLPRFFDVVLKIRRVLGVREPVPRFSGLASATLGVQPEEVDLSRRPRRQSQARPSSSACRRPSR